YVKISIKDHGPGIPQEQLSRIFDPFYTTKVKGHGLGLATSYSIIKRHNGAIDVESEVGMGTTFHIFLPSSKENVLPESKNGTMIHRGEGNILIMDDEPDVLEVVGEMVMALGYNAILTQNGQEAIDKHREELNAGRKIKAMLFDLTINGGMGGKEAITEIRKLDKDVPVFVVSGYSKDPVIANAADYQFTASLPKPFKLDDLIALFNRFLH
ncbi:MAG: response regulator, partial [Fibrobacteres bacterium]|nr:response regulator [Fibrobacterota bacterium]